MLLRLLLLFTVVPYLEFTILWTIGQRLGWQAALGVVVGTGILGAYLARREGLRVLFKIQEEMSRGVPPAGSLVDGLLVFAAAVVLVTPGLITDLCGFALLIPAVRALVRRRLVKHFEKRVVVFHSGCHPPGAGPAGGANPDDDFIDVSATAHDVEDTTETREIESQ